MKRASWLAGLYLVAGSLVGGAYSSAATAGDQDFVVENATGVDIHQLHVSPHSTNDWEEDILGQDVLLAGDSVEITFSRDEDEEMWDLQVTDSDGNAIVWENLNLLEISNATLHYRNGRAWADLE